MGAKTPKLSGVGAVMLDSNSADYGKRGDEYDLGEEGLDFDLTKI